MNISVKNLGNNIRLVHNEVPHLFAVHCGVIIGCGSRDDKIGGEAHFIEHMLFKGTKKRKAYQVINRIESVGGEIDAYTSKEYTTIYAAVIKEHFERSVELLADILWDSTFVDREFQKEKSVILEEIAMYGDDPTESIHEDFEQLIFEQHSLGKKILGQNEEIQEMTAEHLQKHYFDQFLASPIVISVCGNIALDEAETIITKYFSEKLPKIKFNRAPPSALENIRNVELRRPIIQAHLVFGNRFYPKSEEERISFALLINYLGGNNMNSLLNMKIREKHGLVYDIYSFFTSFTDVSFWGIYTASSGKNIQKVQKLMKSEINQLIQKGISDQKLNQIKKQLIGNLMLNQDNIQARMILNGKSLLFHDEIETVEQKVEVIRNMNSEIINQLISESFIFEKLHQIKYLPKK